MMWRSACISVADTRGLFPGINRRKINILFAVLAESRVDSSFVRQSNTVFLRVIAAELQPNGPMRRPYTILNVFTAGGEGGNPLAVVTESAGLDTQAMQAIALNFNLSETVFVLPPAGPAHTAAIRIFTPQAELPFAGHPTVGTGILMARDRVWRQAGGEFDALVALETKAGVVRVGVTPGTGGAPFGEFDAPVLPKSIGDAAPDDRLAAALGLAPHEIGFENHRPSRYSAGVPFTFVPVQGLDAIGRAQDVAQYWDEAFGADTHKAAYLYCRETVRHKAAFHARMFAPGMGMKEDPATGSAAIALAGVIHRFDDPPEGLYEGMIEQGLEMGQPCELHLEFEVENRNIRVVRIGGQAVVLEEGFIEA
jgi:trans-2,3-dihydro-3-hydroxyanthranilate isomerase